MFIIGILLKILISESKFKGCEVEESFSCIKCLDSYWLTEGLCLSECPSFYSKSNSSCTQDRNLLFSLDFKNYKGYEEDSIKMLSTSMLDGFEVVSEKAPIPTFDRGLYFKKNSQLESLNSWRPGPLLSISSWIKIIDPGLFFSVSFVLIINFSESKVEASTFSIKEDKRVQTFVSTDYDLGKWNKITLMVYQKDFQTITKIYAKNFNEAYCENSEARYEKMSYNWKIGGFKGFVYKIQGNNQLTILEDEVYLIDCEVEEYWDGKICKKTDENCENWAWCTEKPRKHKENFNKRKLQTCFQNCDVCIDANLGDCTTCTSGFNNLQGVCIAACPTGWLCGESSSSLTKDFIFNLDLSNVISNTVVDQIPPGLSVTSGLNSSFYPNYDSNDPYATKERGYYFGGSAYMQINPNTLIFAPIFTIYTWINSEVDDGVIFAKQNSSNFEIISLKLETKNIRLSLTEFSFISSRTISTFSWNFIGIQLSLSASIYYSAIIYINDAYDVVSAPSSGWFDDLNTVFTLSLGSEWPLPSNSFTGFLWIFCIYNSDSVSLSLKYSGITPPSNCLITQYYSSSCQNCNANCNKGCVRNDAKCNLCYDELCLNCPNFDNSCTQCFSTATGFPCACPTGSLWNASTQICDLCTPNCDICSTTNYTDCTKCSSGFFLCQSVCISSCPTGYTSDSTTRVCTMSSSLIFDLAFDSIQDTVTDSASGFVVTTGPNNSFYPSYATGDPYATRYRGYYFTGLSYMQGPPNTASSSNIYLSPQFTITMWINPGSNTGTILAKQLVSDATSLSVSLSTGSIVGTVSLSSSCSITGSIINLNAWNFVVLQGFISSTPGYQMSVFVNNTLRNSSFFETNWFQDSGTYLTFGALRNAGSFTSYYKGFVYEIRIYNDVILPSIVASSACTGCSFCPLGGSCLYNCPINYYYDGTKCTLCKAACAAVGCVRFDTACNLCNDILCSVCSDYTSVCGTCKTHASLSSNLCACDSGYGYDSTTQTCQSCFTGCISCTTNNQISCTSCSAGYYLISSTCLAFCPTGYTVYGNTCVLDGSNGYIFSILMNSIQDVVTDSQKSFQVTTGIDTNFYPNYRPSDPYASQRGYYFTGSSYMSLPPNYAQSSYSIIFSPILTVSAWLRYSASGTIINKQSNSSPYTSSLKLSLSGQNPTIMFLITNNNIQSTVSWSCSTALNTTSWHQVAFKLTLNSGTYIECIIDKISEGSILVGYNLFIDYSTSFTITIGADSGASFLNNYTGYLYSLKIWNINANPVSLDTDTCTGCSICPPSGCLPNCGIDQYWDGFICQSCKSACASKGCIRADTVCNLCSSQLCYLCTDFSSCTNTAGSCINNATPSPCACNSDYYFDSALDACTLCPSACSSCTSSTLIGCNSCTGTTYSVFGLCRYFCPSGYIISGNSCVAQNTLILSLTFDKISGLVYDTSSSGMIGVTGTTFAFYPKYESKDPIAAKYRGYYFDGANSIINLPPYSNYSSPIVYLSPQVTVDAWIYPMSGTGTILSKQDITNFSFLYMLGLSASSLILTANYGNLGVYKNVCALALSLNSWHYIGYSVNYMSGNSVLICYIDGLSSSYTLSQAYIDDTTTTYKILLGSSFVSSTTYTNYYKGFIYSISIQNTVVVPNNYTSTCTGGCSLCPLNGNCLASCSIDQYYTGPSYDQCASCNSNCTNVGCINSGVSCTLCADIKCYSCTDFVSGTCTACKANASNTASCACNTGFYWDSVNEVCANCHSSCSTCLIGGFMNCQTCASGYKFLNNACHPYCPTGLVSDGLGGCSLVNSTAFNLNPSKIQGVIYDNISSIPVLTGSSANFYPTLEADDPYPLQSRGYYFSGSSIMKLPPSALFPTPLFLFGNTFMISAWIFHMSDGTLLSTQSSLFGISLQIIISSQPIIKILLQDSGTIFSYTCLSTLSAYWNFLGFQVQLQSNGNTAVQCTVNTVTDSPSILTYGYYIGYSSYFTLGAIATSGTAFAQYWSGELYSLKFYNTYAVLSETTNSCNTLPFFCTLCPASTGICINKCAYNTFWDGVQCSNCASGCMSCVRNDFICNLCYDPICYKCSDYTSGACTVCKPNASLLNGACSCNQYYYWNKTVLSCLSCNSVCNVCTGSNYLDCSSCISGYYWFYGICLLRCPSGYTGNTNTWNCDLNYQLVLNLNFDTMSGQPVDTSQSTILTRAGSSTAFYPSYESDDPYASFMRGFYFTGASKVYIPPYQGNTLPLLILAPDITFNAWIRPSSDGWIICHQNNAVGVSIYFGIKITASKASVNIRLLNSGLVAVDTVSALTLNSWSHIGFLVNVTKSLGTQITSYLNNVEMQQITYSFDYFPAPTSNFLWIIGTQYSTTSTFTSFFTGYIYSLSLWNALITSSNWGLSSTCTANPSACSVCPAGNVCIPDCGLNNYYDPVNMVCGPCKSSCTTGCRNATYCNLCFDPICSSCLTFSSGSCSTCKANAGFIGTNCNCNTNYIWYGLLETCSMCYTGCSACLTPIHNACTLCQTGYFLTYSECLNFCPFLFTSNNVTNTCTAPSNIKVFKLSLASIILGQVSDSINNFTVQAGSSLSFYPTYDTYDPLAADIRGYYFNGNSMMNIQTSPKGLLNFPSRMTVGMWINYKQDGTLLSKQFILNPSNKAIEFMVTGGKLFINMLLTTGQFSATSVSSLSVNSWSYVSFQLTVLSNATSQITFMINNANDPPYMLALDYFMDLSTSFTFIIGAEYSASSVLTNFFTGFIWSISMWQDAITNYSQEFSTTCTGCSICTVSSSCLSTCPANTFTPSCTNCSVCTTTTCVSASTCNLCSDLKCLICKDYTSTGCTQCVVNAGFTNGIGSPCGCNSGYSWDSTSQTCVLCANLCAPCYNLQTTGCTGCIPNTYWNQNVCQPWCPTGFTPGTSSCSGTGGLIFQVNLLQIQGIVTDQVNGKIQLMTGLSSAFYPSYDANDPYAVQYRGYYFNGVSAYMSFISNSNNNNQMVLSPLSTIGIWVFPSLNSATLMSKKTSSIINYLIFEITSTGNLKISLLLKLISPIYSYTSSKSVILNTWNHIGYAVNIVGNNTQVTVYHNGIADTPYVLAAGHYEDLVSGYIFSIAANFTTASTISSYFQGYIYEIKIWNINYALSNEVGSCSSCVCPSNPAVCLSTCSLNQYSFLGTCYNCSATCTTGCVRSSDCNLCYDVLCTNCNDFTSAGCTACKTNANLLSSGACQCKSGSYLNSATQTCPSCFAYCSNCTSNKNGDCNGCVTLSYMNPENGVCLTSCPVGYVLNSVLNLCSPVNANSLAVLFKFNQLTNSVVDSIGGYTAFMGLNTKFVGSFDPNDPYPIYGRGLYFTGSSFVVLPPNLVDVSSIILGNSHSISMWIRPQSHSSKHFVVSKEDGVNLRASLYIDQTTLISYGVYTVFSDTTNIKSVITATGPTLSSWDTWYQIQSTLSRTGYTTEVRVYLNGQSGLVSSLPNTFFQDVNSNSFKLGYSSLQNSFMKGFIYEIRIYNYVRSFAAPSTSCGCGGCTEDGDCLNTCGYLSYYSNGCIACLATCTTGCVNGNNCNLNLDNLCATATSFAISGCTSCISLASGAGNGCQCQANSFYNSTTSSCQCNLGYTFYNNQCVPCFYPLQSTDINAYFSSSFLQLIFNCTYAVQSTISSQCSDLFDAGSYSKLGNSPTCVWNTARTSLTVSLGINATVTESFLTFQSQTLYTNQKACGYSPVSVTVYVKYIYTKPNIVPIPWLLAPLQSYIQCDDLTLDGSKSSNGYNRPLWYSWIFVSSPNVTALSGYQNQNISNAQLFFSKASLSPANVAVTMIVTNWLGFSASITQNIQIMAGQGLHLILDANTQWVMTTADSKTILIQATSSCSYSSSLSYTWGITSQNGTYAAVDSVALWKAQTVLSRIYIPPQVLKPGTYTFQVNVTDNTNGFSGSAQFTVTIIMQSLVITVPATYMTVDVNSPLKINAQQCTDPDNLPGSLNYNWACVYSSTNCTSLIIDPFTSILSINSGLASGTIYTLNLTVFKDIRSSFALITIKAVSFSCPAVTFTQLGNFVNSQLPVMITASIDQTGDYTYLWSLETGGAYQASTQLTTTQIGFKPNTLTQGTNYVFRFEVIQNNNVCVNKVSFSVLQQPTGGSLSISPNIGTEMNTIFYLQALNWQDASNPTTGILSYEFGFNYNNQAITLNIRNQSYFYYTQFPYSASPLVVWVKVINSNGGYSLSSTTVTIIKNKNFISDSLLSSFTNYLANDLSDPSVLPGFINLVSIYYLANSSVSENQKSSAYSSIISAIDTLISTTTTFQNADIENILNTMSIVTKYYQPTTPDSIVARLYNILSLTIASGVVIDTNQVSYYVNTLQQSTGFNTNMINDSPETVADLNNNIKNVLVAAGLSMAYGQSISYQTSQIHIVSTLFNSNNFTDYYSPLIPGYSGSVYLPFLGNSSYTGSLLSVFILYDDKGASASSTSLPTSIDFSIIQITTTGNTTLSMSLTNPLSLTLPIYNYSTGIIECVYMNNDWSSYGCEFKSYSSGLITCLCNHTSLFSAGVNLVPYIPPPAPPVVPKTIDTTISMIMFYYICGVLGLWIIASSVLLIVDQNESVLRRKAEELANARFAKWFKTEDLIEKIEPEKKTNESQTLDQNPTFFRKTNKEPEIVYSDKKIEQNPFLKGTDTLESANRPGNIGFISGNKHITENFDEYYLTPSKNPFAQNYFVASFIFYDCRYTRLNRYLAFITSLCLQEFLIGLGIYFLSDFLSLPDNANYSDSFYYLTYIDVLFTPLVVVVANFVSYFLQILMNNTSLVRQSGENLNKSKNKARCTRLASVITCLSLIAFVVLAVYFIANRVYTPHSIIWLDLTVICGLFDMVLFQNSKVIIYFIKNRKKHVVVPKPIKETENLKEN